MPLTRDEARRCVLVLLQQQVARASSEHGALLLTVWHAIRDEQQDIRLLQVYERYTSADGSAREELRFPGFGDMWIPGLYLVTVMSREALDHADANADDMVAAIRAELAAGTAEVIFAEPGAPKLFTI